MIWLNPENVTLGTFALRDVTHIAIDRAARRTAEEWTDLGPHAGFVDVPEQRVTVFISRQILETETSAPKPGETHALTFRTGPRASASANRLVTLTAVVTSVEHSISKSGRATQSIRATAISSDGAVDPVTETAVEGEL